MPDERLIAEELERSCSHLRNGVKGLRALRVELRLMQGRTIAGNSPELGQRSRV
jgi:hypothetical protein